MSHPTHPRSTAPVCHTCMAPYKVSLEYRLPCYTARYAKDCRYSTNLQLSASGALGRSKKPTTEVLENLEYIYSFIAGH